MSIIGYIYKIDKRSINQNEIEKRPQRIHFSLYAPEEALATK
jgi:hypothetical protein